MKAVVAGREKAALHGFECWISVCEEDPVFSVVCSVVKNTLSLGLFCDGNYRAHTSQEKLWF